MSRGFYKVQEHGGIWKLVQNYSNSRKGIYCTLASFHFT
jgi:hypothetical protein